MAGLLEFWVYEININQRRRWLNDADGTEPWNAHAACLKKDIKMHSFHHGIPRKPKRENILVALEIQPRNSNF